MGVIKKVKSGSKTIPLPQKAVAFNRVKTVAIRLRDEKT